MEEKAAMAEDVARPCERLEKALLDCHRRTADGPARQSACRHLNRRYAECIVGVICPSQSEAVRSLCSTAGTALKRSQCRQAQLSLSACLSSHQDHYQS
ncbi:hypothetical protein RND81_04G244400 [Saponaria officinalis]|uniref:COX assembly mitochondrial protein n=1 Tax=Saponaria officinalis TaxID=3572 RepID=A0AAW1LPG0_SAPOF